MRSKWCASVFMSVAAGAFAAPAFASTIYLQSFVTNPAGNGGGTNHTFQSTFGTNFSNDLSAGWGVYATPTAKDYSNYDQAGPGYQADRQTPATSGSGTPAGSNYGIVVLTGGSGIAAPVFAGTTDLTSFNPAQYTGLTFSFWQGDALSTDFLRVAVQIGGQWYASAGGTGTSTNGGTYSAGKFYSTNGQTAAGFAATATTGNYQTYTYSATAANWDLLNFTPSTTTGTPTVDSPGTVTTAGTLSLGTAATSNLSGNITGVGLFTETAPAGNVRFDQFLISGTLSSVPEPASMCLLACGSLAILARRRR
jgi:hypothetical protein